MDFEALNTSGKKKVLILGRANRANLALIEWLLDNHVEVFFGAEDSSDSDHILKLRWKYPHETFKYKKINYLDINSISPFIKSVKENLKSIDFLIMTDTAKKIKTKFYSEQAFEANMAKNYFFTFSFISQVIHLLSVSYDPKIIVALNPPEFEKEKEWEEIFFNEKDDFSNSYTNSQSALKTFLATLQYKIRTSEERIKVYGIDMRPYLKSLPSKLVSKISSMKFYVPFLYAMTDTEAKDGVFIKEKCQKSPLWPTEIDLFLWNYSEDLVHPFDFFEETNILTFNRRGDAQPDLRS